MEYNGSMFKCRYKTLREWQVLLQCMENITLHIEVKASSVHSLIQIKLMPWQYPDSPLYRHNREWQVISPDIREQGQNLKLDKTKYGLFIKVTLATLMTYLSTGCFFGWLWITGVTDTEAQCFSLSLINKYHYLLLSEMGSVWSRNLTRWKPAQHIKGNLPGSLIYCDNHVRKISCKNMFMGITHQKITNASQEFLLCFLESVPPFSSIFHTARENPWTRLQKPNIKLFFILKY